MNKSLKRRNPEELLDEVILSKGLVTVCSYCGNVKDLQGKWFTPGTLIENCPKKILSHGICRACLDSHFGGTPWYKRAKEKV